ncbi:transcriptional regulator [Acutalibacter sp. JLR.KK004]|jgi:transposase|uniref:helix-turn-helix domain-containing protein n=1 Tax=Acutalibacter sp. JLR.KK004 TaxID=3112622 RepID=UPI002FEEECA1
MLRNEARKLLVQAYEQTHDAQAVAKCFHVSTSTVYRLSGQMKKTGSVDLQTSQRGRKPALTEKDLQDIDQLITAQPDITIDEIIEKQGLSVSNETVRKAVIGLGYIYKKKSFYTAERERVRCCGGERGLE